MSEVMLALKRSLTTLGRGRVWLYMLIPALLTLVVLALLLYGAVAWLEARTVGWARHPQS